MSGPVDEAALRAGLDDLSRARPWPDGVTAAFEAQLRAGDDADVFRMNPLRFAARTEVPETVATDLFLHGVSCGLLIMEWSLFCPYCGRIHVSLRSLSHVHGAFRCDYCQVDHSASLDDFLELSFTVSPAVRPIRYHRPEGLDPGEYLLVYRTTANARALDGRPWRQVLEGITPFVAVLRPGEAVRADCSIVPGLLQGSDVTGTAEFRIDPVGEGSIGGDPLRFVLRDGAFAAPRQAVAGDAVIELRNEEPRDALVALHNLPTGMPIVSVEIEPFLSGKTALTSQTFRDLFGGEVVRTAEGLRVRTVALLFTDLKGSTALYDRIGDLSAFSLVQRHFEVLRAVVAEHGGSIVKTIGDAVMASFAEPSQAVAAALAMRGAIAAFNRGKGDRALVLKIGVHAGPAIAVTLNDRLDWFGQTVNIAARVQGLSEAGEVCLTADVAETEGVAALLAGTPVESRMERLRGVTAGMLVHRIAPLD